MRCVVIGGAGFIGSHLCDRLLADEQEVVCLDNLCTGDKKNIKHNLANPQFSFKHFDIIKTAPKIDGKVDWVFNLASPASPVDYNKFPIETLSVGSIGVLNSLKLARQKKAKYLFSSTSEVYGDPEVSPQPESYWGRVNPVGERSQYDEAKRFGEALVVAYRKKYRIDAKIIRIFNTYGPRMRPRDGRVIPNFISQALAQQPFTVYGDGRQTRSFCYVDDLVDGIMLMMKSSELGPINLGNPHEFTMVELAKLIAKLMKCKLKIIGKKLPPDDPKQRCPNIKLAKRRLRWLPRVNFVRGLKKNGCMVLYYTIKFNFEFFIF